MALESLAPAQPAPSQPTNALAQIASKPQTRIGNLLESADGVGPADSPPAGKVGQVGAGTDPIGQKDTHDVLAVNDALNSPLGRAARGLLSATPLGLPVGIMTGISNLESTHALGYAPKSFTELLETAFGLKSYDDYILADLDPFGGLGPSTPQGTYGLVDADDVGNLGVPGMGIGDPGFDADDVGGIGGGSPGGGSVGSGVGGMGDSDPAEGTGF